MDMKNKAFILTLALAGCVAFSCSDDEAASVSPVFPESISCNLHPEEEGELKFNASLNWQLLSDKQWLKFIDEDGAMVQHLTGKAGEQTVRFTVTDGAQGFDADKVIITLRQGSEEKTVAEVTRTAKERIVKMYQPVGNTRELAEVSELVDNQFDTQKTERIGFYANFDWKLDTESLPAWIVEDESNAFLLKNLSGEAGQEVSFERMANLDVDIAARYQDVDGFITIRDLNSDYTCQFPVHAPAIEASKIHWVGQLGELKSGYVWDGKAIQVKAKQTGSGMEYTWIEEPVKCHVVTRNNKFTPHFVQWNASTKTATEVSAEESWVKVEKQEGGFVTLKADEYPVRGSSRDMMLFLLPEGVEIDDFTSEFESYGYSFDQNRYGINLKQYGLSGGFGIGAKDMSTYRFKVNAEGTEVNDKSEIIEKLKLAQTNNIYEYTVTAEEWDAAGELSIMPLGLELLGRWQLFKIYNEKFEYLGIKPEGWSTATSWQRLGAYPEAGTTYSYYLNMTNRLPFADITDNCLYIVFCKDEGEGQDVGTIVIRKQQ